MADTSTYPLRLPRSLKAEVAKLAKEEGASVNQFIALAVAEKVSALETEKFFKEKAQGVNLDTFQNILMRDGGQPPQEGDEIL